MRHPPTYEAILGARERIAPHVHVTPVLTSAVCDAEAGARLFFKCENFQKSGAFKARGAHNAVFALEPDEAARGVVTHSSGNHGAALALAARRRGIRSTIIVPERASSSKVIAIERYGGRLIRCAPTLAAREAASAQAQAETGAHLVHPYNDPWVIAGQATAAVEFLEQVPELNTVIAPVGGGGLLSGTALAARNAGRVIAVFGAEPSGADDAARSFAAGHLIPQTNPQTAADGLGSSLGELTFAVISREVTGILTVSEDQLWSALRQIWQVLKIVVEPSSAVAYAAVRAHPGYFRGRTVGIILTGGNVDWTALPHE